MPVWAALIPVALWAIDKMSQGSVSGGGAISDASQAMSGAMNTAMGQIKDSTDKALKYNEPYLNPEQFKRMSDLIQSGAFQKPFQKSWQAPAWNTQGFNFNPAAGGMRTTPWQTPSAPTITPQGLPQGMAGLLQRPVPQVPQSPQTPPTNPLGPMNPTWDDIVKLFKATVPQNTPTNPAVGASSTIPGGVQNSTSRNVQTGEVSATGVGNGGNPYGRIDPKNPTMQDYYALIQKYPWLIGRSGPLEGGMPGTGTIGTGVPKPTPTTGAY